MSRFLNNLMYRWWYFKVVVLGVKPGWLSEPDPCSCPTEPLFKEGDLIFDKDTETVWVVEIPPTTATDGVFTYRLGNYLQSKLFYPGEDDIIKMNY